MSRPPLGSRERVVWCRDGLTEAVLTYAADFKDLAERLPKDDPAKGRLELLAYAIDKVREAEHIYLARKLAEAEVARTAGSVGAEVVSR